MLDKIKSIKNNLRIGDKLEELRIKEMSAQITGFFKKIYGFIYRFFDLAGKNFSRSGISANLVSVSGFVIGIFAINFLAMEMYGYALFCILVNRAFDALDGAIARHSEVTDFGIFLDAALDYIFYAGVIFGFALANPYDNAVAAGFLLFAFAVSSCALLAYAVVAYKNNSAEKLNLNQSPFYLGGFAQGFETFTALVVLCIVPGWFMPIAIILGVLSLVKALSVIAAAYYNFVIALKAKKKNNNG